MPLASQTLTLVYLLVGALSLALSALYLAWRASRRDKERRRRKKQD